MKIALLHNSVLPPKTYGGVERILLALAKEYTRLGHEVLIIGREGSNIKDYEFVGVPVDFLTDKINDILPDGLDFLHSQEPLLVKPKIPFLVTIHGNGQSHETYWPNTNFLSQSHARNHNGKFFVYNGIDPDQYPYQETKQDYFVFLARTTWRVKNVKTAITWANDLGVRLEIMGGQGISRGNIRYNGLISEEQKIKLLKNAKALVYPTNWDEPCAAAPLEALACGTPVIASSNGCMPELVRPGTGIVCDSYDKLIAAATQVNSIFPKKCRAAVEEFFSLKRMAQDYLKLINKIMTEGELTHHPQYNFKTSSVHLLYKPTILNRTRLALTGENLMHVLITGGAGFIGSHLAAEFLAGGFEVTVFDNLSLGRKEFLSECLKNKKFRFVEADLLDIEKVKGALDKVDLVYHLAANSDISNGIKNTDVDLKNGTLATYNLLEVMRLKGVRELVFASSSAIYGEALIKPTPENYGPLVPISFYGASKLACEALCMAFSHNYGIKTWIYRFANIVGPHSTHGVIYDFVNRLKENSKTLKVLGNGTQKKSYLHVNDCIDGMIFGYKNSKHLFQFFNLASAGVTEVKFIAETVSAKALTYTKSKATLEYGIEDRGWKGDVPFTHLDGTLFAKLGWKAKLDSNAAVEKAIDEILKEALNV